MSQSLSFVAGVIYIIPKCKGYRWKVGNPAFLRGRPLVGGVDQLEPEGDWLSVIANCGVWRGASKRYCEFGLTLTVEQMADEGLLVSRDKLLNCMVQA